MRINRLLQREEVSAIPQLAAIAVLAALALAVGIVAGSARAEAAPAPRPAIVVMPDAPFAPSKVESQPANLAAPIRTSRPAVTIPAATIPAVTIPAATPEPMQPSSDPQQAVKIAGGIAAGQILSKVQPTYPTEARQACVQGAVILSAIISKTGDVEQLQVISGPLELRTSALDAVRQWKYRPYLLNGEPVDVETTVTINYSIAESATCPTARNDAPADLQPRKVGGSVSAPTLLTAPSPDYSPEAKAEKVSGSVIVNFWVDEHGIPTHIHVVRGIGHGLDEKAVEAIKLYRFKPAFENGTPVVVALNTEVRFEIF